MRILAISLVLMLAGCLPALNDNRAIPEPVEAPWTHGYRVEVAGVFVAASSAPIVAVDGPGCVLRSTLAGGPNSAVSCEAPGRYKLQTAGRVSAGVVVR
jgi:hypothetical protein